MTDHTEGLEDLREKSALVFVNPAAGRGRARSYLPRIRKLFESLEIPARFLEPSSASELESAARQAISQNQRFLLAMGGDGTFQALANGVLGADVLVGILPTGGGNDFATALGIPDDPVRAAEAVLRGKPRHVDLVRVRTGDGRARLYAGGGGVGLDAEAARYANGKYRHLPGRLRYIASLLHALGGYASLDVQVEFPSSEYATTSANALLLCVLKTPTYGAGLRLAPDAALDDGLLHAVLIEDLSAREILKLLPRLTMSGELRTSRVKRWGVKCLRLTTSRPCLFHGDGEILGPTPVEIELAPRAVKMLAPVQA